MRIGVGSMHGSMAIRAASDVSLGIMGGTDLCDGMAVDAGPGLIRRKQVVGTRAMRNVAIATVLLNRRVVVDPGSRLSLVALRAPLGLCAELRLLGLMGRMAVRTTEHPLAHGMVRGEVQPRSHLCMAIYAESRIGSCIGQNIAGELCGNTDVAGLAIMRVMAVCTKKTRALVFGELPAQ